MVTMLILAAAVTVQQAAILPSNGSSISVTPEIARRYPNGIEVFKVVVSPEGVISTCVASIDGHGPITDLANCKKVTRFKAKPAIDQNGQKTYGTAELVTSWSVIRSGDTTQHPLVAPRLGPDFLLPLSRFPSGIENDARSGLVLVAGIDGKVETCLVQQTSGLTALDEAACRAVAVTGVTPARDAAGAAVRAVHSISVGFSVNP
jgi:hypothetical protein